MATEQNLKTDIELIKKDIKQIERFFDKVDDVVSAMSEQTKSLAVQQQIIEHFSSKLEDIEERMLEHKKEDVKRTEELHRRLEQYRKSSKEDHKRLADESAANRILRNQEIMEELDKLNGNLERRITKIETKIETQNERLRMVENLKWWALGAIAVIVFFAQFVKIIDISGLFG